jgi:4-aminobutyrate aminotransferase-like enzyme
MTPPAREVITVLREEQLIARSARLGASFLAGLRELAERHSDMVKEVRGRGLMIAMELAGREVTPVYQQLLERGFAVGCKPAANLLRFYPPLIIEEAHIAALLENLDDIFSDGGS